MNPEGRRNDVTNEKDLDWFRQQREQEALRNSYVETYADSETDISFYAIESFDVAFCLECAEETEILEEVNISFDEDSAGNLGAEIIRLKIPRRYCRECLSGVTL